MCYCYSVDLDIRISSRNDRERGGGGEGRYLIFKLATIADTFVAFVFVNIQSSKPEIAMCDYQNTAYSRAM